MSMEKALEAVRNGQMILIYDFDNREKETDMTIASQFVTYERITQMREDAGGLLCTIMPHRLAMDIGLPFLSDVFWDAGEKYPVLRMMAPSDIPYDRTKSSFGVTINHRDTYTGIPDRDRALTISRFCEVIFQDKPADEIAKDLGKEFRAPGHVHLLNTTDRLLETRHGHTELAAAMMYMAGVKPSATICEMMGHDGHSKNKEECFKYAQEHDIPIVTGDEIIAAWKEFKSKNPGLDV
ncbi:MAG: 3,4-dihydroxy-2-butanone-4-phosphate synthase [archaeon]|nr:3,4-dihydroxy-2-butanone-4-phosphate synthase [archaeon]